jgi:hypothetical protein
MLQFVTFLFPEGQENANVTDVLYEARTVCQLHASSEADHEQRSSSSFVDPHTLEHERDLRVILGHTRTAREVTP